MSIDNNSPENDVFAGLLCSLFLEQSLVAGFMQPIMDHVESNNHPESLLFDIPDLNANIYNSTNPLGLSILPFAGSLTQLWKVLDNQYGSGQHSVDVQTLGYSISQSFSATITNKDFITVLTRISCLQRYGDSKQFVDAYDNEVSSESYLRIGANATSTSIRFAQLPSVYYALKMLTILPSLGEEYDGAYLPYFRSSDYSFKKNVQIKTDKENAQAITNFLKGVIAIAAVVAVGYVVGKAYMKLKSFRNTQYLNMLAAQQRFGNAVTSGNDTTLIVKDWKKSKLKYNLSAKIVGSAGTPSLGALVKGSTGFSTDLSPVINIIQP